MQIETQELPNENAAMDRTRQAWRQLLGREETRRALRQILLLGCDEAAGTPTGPLSADAANFRNGSLRVAQFIRQQCRLHDFEGLQRFDAEYEAELQQLHADRLRIKREARLQAPPPPELPVPPPAPSSKP